MGEENSVPSGSVIIDLDLKIKVDTHDHDHPMDGTPSF